MPPKNKKAEQKAIDVAKATYQKVFGKLPKGKSASDPAWIYGEIHDRTTFVAAQAAQRAQSQITQQQIDVNVIFDSTQFSTIASSASVSLWSLSD
jgi:hypothetical protein